MPKVIELVDLETGETIERVGADALEILRERGDRFKLKSSVPIAPVVRPPVQPDGPPMVDTPYIPPSQRAAVTPEPVVKTKTIGPRKQRAINAKRAAAAQKRAATMEAKKQQSQPEANAP